MIVATGAARATTWLTATVLVVALGVGCASTVVTGSLVRTGRIEGELHRGVSTGEDVRRVLGRPEGSGSALLPADPRPREVWVYGYARSGKARDQGAGVVHMDSERQFLLVFFLGDVFDGFMWYEADTVAEARPR